MPPKFAGLGRTLAGWINWLFETRDGSNQAGPPLESVPPLPQPAEFGRLLARLRAGSLTIQGQPPYGSNSTYYVSVSGQGQALVGVYKPSRGARPLWDFPYQSLAGREVAAFLVSEALGWHLVPPTVYRRHAPHGAGSLQLYIPHQSELPYFRFAETEQATMRQIALFDLLVNNADRKRSHVLRDAAGKLWSIDHGLCFHVQSKLRTFIGDLAGQPLPASLREDLAAFPQRLADDSAGASVLAPFLTPAEISALERRVANLLAAGRYADYWW